MLSELAERDARGEIATIYDEIKRRLLAGEKPAARTEGGSWTPPSLLPALPALVDVTALPPAERGVLMSLGTPVDGQPFVPGLYRMLARWPHFLAHVATELQPHCRRWPPRPPRRRRPSLPRYGRRSMPTARRVPRWWSSAG